MFGKIMHVNGTSLYRPHDTPHKSHLIVKQDAVGKARQTKEKNEIKEDVNLERIFAKLNRGEELDQSEINYVRLHDTQLYADISWLYTLRDEVLQSLATLSFEAATLFMKKEKEELSKSLQWAYKKDHTTTHYIQLLEWYYSLLDKVWYRYLKQREDDIRHSMEGKIA